ncbi:MAG: RNA methyltransferase [Acidimicrobiales bacterium]|nr:RNA methyltransferase [Acidimicrobiales bacterium]
MARRLARHRRDRVAEQRFVIEGPTLIADALAAGLRLDYVLLAIDDDGHPLTDPIFEESLVAHDVEAYGVAKPDFDGLSSTKAPQPALAVAPLLIGDLDAALLRTLAEPFVVALVDVADPGNVGTLIRAAEAAGAHAVAVTGDTADVFNPKTVRAAAGSLFRLPVVVFATAPDLARALAERSIATFGARMDGSLAYDQAPFAGPTALLIGNEAHGLPADLRLDHRVTIPMLGAPESLNAAMAGTVLAFEVARQRRARSVDPTV